MAVTIMDVARTSGVSKATVSRAFIHPEIVDPDTLSRIRRNAERLGYRPNAIARAMITKRTGNIAFIIYGRQAPVITNPFYGPILETVVAEAQKCGYSVFIVSDEELRLSTSDTLLQKQVDGVIFASQPDNEMVELFQKSGTPIVLVNHRSEKRNLPAVISDDYAGVRLAMEHLIESGHERIALLSGNFTEFIRLRREEAYRDALLAAHLPYDPRYIGCVEPHVADAEAGMLKVFERTSDARPTAVMAMNDTIAAGAIKAAHARGLSVPKDFAVIGYDDSSICELTEPTLSSVDGGKTAMGAEAVRLLTGLMRGEAIGENVVVLDAKLVLRRSTENDQSSELAGVTR